MKDNLEINVLTVKLLKLKQGDGFEMEKGMLVEIEDLSNQAEHQGNGVLIAQAKALVFEAMIAKGQKQIAIDYVKKVMLKFSAN